MLRAISSLNCIIDFVTVGAVSHGFGPQILVFADADFASCPWTSKSTSGIFIAIATGETLFPIFWQSQKQSSFARSSSESELIAMYTALFGKTLQAQDMLTYLLGKRPDVILKQDNEADIKIVCNRYSVKLRHCGRVHRVTVPSVSSLVDETDQCISLEYCNTQLQLANPLNKILSPQSWAETLRQVCVQPFTHPFLASVDHNLYESWNWPGISLMLWSLKLDPMCMYSVESSDILWLKHCIKTRALPFRDRWVTCSVVEHPKLLTCEVVGSVTYYNVIYINIYMDKEPEMEMIECVRGR